MKNDTKKHLHSHDSTVLLALLGLIRVKLNAVKSDSFFSATNIFGVMLRTLARTRFPEL